MTQEEVFESQAKKIVRQNDYTFEVGSYLKELTGIDLMEDKVFSENTPLTILSETGTDMTHFQDAKQFVR